MQPIALAYNLLRHLGPGFAWRRGLLQFRRFTGITKRQFPIDRWDDISLSDITVEGTPSDAVSYASFKRENAPAFFFPFGVAPQLRDRFSPEGKRLPPLEERLSLLAEGRAMYFFNQVSPSPIDWYENAFDQKRSDHTRPWYSHADYLAQQGDPRFLWEPSRAAWAFDLARAAAYFHPDDPARIYHNWLCSWLDACPPFTGFQWVCGQESAIRLIAVLFGFWAVADELPDADNQWLRLARFAWATAYRIDRQIDYAVSQKNNHSLNEALALLFVGQLFSEFREAKQWWHKGSAIFAQELKRQVYPDGSYVQHSFNYQRLALDASVLALRLGEIAGRPFDRGVYERVDRMVNFLYQMHEPSTGHLPLYGHNDGAYLLPLSECEFADFRPSLQTAHFLIHGKCLFDAGPWDEPIHWLFGQSVEFETTSPSPALGSKDFATGGHFTIRQADSWAMLRCHHFRDRPGQADQLHLDLFWRGTNVLRDCGTYRYFTPDQETIGSYFKSVAAHNRIEIDGQDPFQRPTRFLSFPWPRGRATTLLQGSTAIVVAETDDYQRSPFRVRHRRTLLGLGDDVWLVVDDLLGTGRHLATLRYHLADFAYQEMEDGLILQPPGGAFRLRLASEGPNPVSLQVIKGVNTPDSFEAFAAPHYGELKPIPLLKAQWQADLPLRILTLAGVPQTTFARGAEGVWLIRSGTRNFEIQLPELTTEFDAYGRGIKVFDGQTGFDRQ